MVFFDLSHSIENGMTFFPGDPQPRVAPAAGAQPPWQVSDLRLGSHTGTHIDAACHFIGGGKSIDQYAPGRFILDGIVVRALDPAANKPMGTELLSSLVPQMPEGGAVLLQTDWDRFWKTEQYGSHPFLSREAAQILRTAGISLVGIDALNVDSTVDGTSDVHEILLGADILIVENLRGLSQLEPLQRYRFSFLPLRITGSDGSPVRAIAWESQSP